MSTDSGTVASYYQEQELFTTFPEDHAMTAVCPVHGTPFQLIPSGISKTTGNPYPAFWACQTRGCKQKPPADAQDAPQAPRAQAPAQAPARASQTHSGASEQTLLILGCLDFASRVYQGTGADQAATSAAIEMYTRVRGGMQ